MRKATPWCFSQGWSAKGDIPDGKTLILRDCWGLGMGLTTPAQFKTLLQNLRKEKLDQSAKD